jgi:hypothetical protein
VSAAVVRRRAAPRRAAAALTAFTADLYNRASPPANPPPRSLRVDSLLWILAIVLLLFYLFVRSRRKSRERKYRDL